MRIALAADVDACTFYIVLGEQEPWLECYILVRICRRRLVEEAVKDRMRSIQFKLYTVI